VPWSRAQAVRVARGAGLAVVATGLAATLLLAGGMAALVVSGRGDPPATARGAGDDALWLGHAWVDGRRTQADLDALALRLRPGGIRDVFVHVGPLSPRGSLDPGLRPRARWLVSALHQAVPGLRVQAWLGQVVGRGHLDLGSAQARARVLGSARQVLADGFDGIHYDLEPVPDGDAGYLDLLAGTHALTRPRGLILSVAAFQIEPLPLLRFPDRLVTGHPHWWSTGYLRQVSRQVDQVAVMAYDTGLPSRAAYTGYVRRQTALALRAVPDDVDLLIGVPAFRADNLGHHASAETLTAAIRGVRLGAGAHPPRRPPGLALFADYTATPGDWTVYLAEWSSPR